MNARARNPYLVPFLIASVGVGLCGWYGPELYRQPQVAPADLETSVDAQLALELARRGPQLQPDAEGQQRLRAQIRAELNAGANHGRYEAQRGLGLGLVCLVLAAGGAVFARQAPRQ